MVQNIEALLAETSKRIKGFTDAAVVGLSGGADSTLVAALCALALGPSNVYGLGMPYSSRDADTFNSRSRRFAKRLSLSYYEIPIGPPAKLIIGALDEVKERFIEGVDPNLSKIAMGNVKARMRMAMLYGFSNMLSEVLKGRIRVMGTGNLSEDYIGYDTKGGDALADLFPIGSLFKSEVYQLLDYLAWKGIIGNEDIDRVPSAGLWEGQTDEGELGHTYNEMQPLIEHLIDEQMDPLSPVLITDEEQETVLSDIEHRHTANAHKHKAPPVLNLRKFCNWDGNGYFEEV